MPSRWREAHGTLQQFACGLVVAAGRLGHRQVVQIGGVEGVDLEARLPGGRGGIVFPLGELLARQSGVLRHCHGRTRHRGNPQHHCAEGSKTTMHQGTPFSIGCKGLGGGAGNGKPCRP